MHCTARQLGRTIMLFTATIRKTCRRVRIGRALEQTTGAPGCRRSCGSCEGLAGCIRGRTSRLARCEWAPVPEARKSEWSWLRHSCYCSWNTGMMFTTAV